MGNQAYKNLCQLPDQNWEQQQDLLDALVALQDWRAGVYVGIKSKQINTWNNRTPTHHRKREKSQIQDS